MDGIRKRQGSGFVVTFVTLALLGAGVSGAFGQDAPPPETTPRLPYDPPALDAPDQDADAGVEVEGADKRAARLDSLLAELAEPGRADWQRIEQQVERIWSRSGSPSMDLLLRRAGGEMRAENYSAAADHLTAVTELAPDFAEGWNARATAFYSMGEYALAMADLEHVLALNPEHFGALAGLGLILEQVDEPALALNALRAAERINPNRPDIQESIKRVERSLGTQDL
jgi:tetratricopeptide (TPR) repeat protein